MAAIRSASGISSFSDPLRVYSKSGRITRGRRLPTARSIAAKTVTYDFERLMEGATKLKCSEFGDQLIKNM